MVKRRDLTVEDWLLLGDQFIEGARRLDRSTPNIQVMHPAVVCRAFASEAYLKCLLTVLQTPFEGDHDLKRLYKLLPDDEKKAIKAGFDARMVQRLRDFKAPAGFNVPKSLMGALRQSGEAFVSWRYMKNDYDAWYLGDFPVHVRDRIVLYRPDLARGVRLHGPNP
jgi:hypothetical protein